MNAPSTGLVMMNASWLCCKCPVRPCTNCLSLNSISVLAFKIPYLQGYPQSPYLAMSILFLMCSWFGGVKSFLLVPDEE